jgi:signal peptide peptidase SppA
MKKHLRRRFKASLQQLFAGEQAWAIHEPALGSLFGSLELGEQLTKDAVAAAIGMDSADTTGPKLIGNVAVLGIFGVLSQKATWMTRALGWTSTEALETQFKAALADSQVKAIVFYVDSPGGSALGNEEVSKTIVAGRGVKPIYTYARGLMASAAYYIGSAASQVFASPSSTIGSIGAVSTHVEWSKALAEMGAGVTVVRSAPNKQLWNGVEKLTPDAKASMQKWVGSYGDQFEKAVATNRGLTQADVKARFGQGDAFLASEAAQRGLIDGVMTFEELLAKAQGTPSSSPVSAQGQRLTSTAVVSTPDGTLATGWSDSLAAAHESQASGSSATASAALVSLPPVLSAAIPDVGTAAPTAATGIFPMKVSARVRAALFARGFISSQESDDSMCLVALGAYFAARGEACPQKDGQLEDEKVVTALFAALPSASAATPGNSTSANAAEAQRIVAASGAAANVAAAHEREMLEARQQGAANEQKRSASIKASGKLLNLPEATIDAAIAAGQPYAEVVAAWHTELAGRETPIANGGGNATVTGEGHDRFAADAVLAIQTRLDCVAPKEQAQVTDHVRQLSNAPLSFFARQCLEAAGTRVPQFITNEELMEIAFAMDGPNRVTVGANYSPYSRPGSFPNLLSNLAGKVLDAALTLAEPTYDEYTGVWGGDLPDFKPAPVVAKGQADELDEVLDAEASKAVGLDEEMLSYMLLRRFSNKFELTPVMGANDDLNAFNEGLIGLEMAWENTVNRACLAIATGNVPLLDGNALYDSATHGNDIAGGSGGVPSDAQWDAMNLKVAAQRGIGGKGYIRTPLKVALLPPALWRAAVQSLGDFRVVGETKVPTLDTNVNIYRGTVTLVREPELQGVSNAVWYGFCQPRGMINASIIRAYFRGWGKNGRRQRWYDPATKCWNFELEGRVGVAAKQYRTTVRNPGS